MELCMLWRYLRAFADKAPPEELRNRGLDGGFAGVISGDLASTARKPVRGAASYVGHIRVRGETATVFVHTACCDEDGLGGIMGR